MQKIVAAKSAEFKIEIQALVMMDSHIHILTQTQCKSENYFSSSLQKALGFNEPEAVHCEVISSYSQYLNTYKYIYRNPVVAGICDRVEDYAYSSLYCLLGKGTLHVAVFDQLGLIQNAVHRLKWLNSNDYYKHSQLQWLSN